MFFLTFSACYVLCDPNYLFYSVFISGVRKRGIQQYNRISYISVPNVMQDVILFARYIHSLILLVSLQTESQGTKARIRKLISKLMLVCMYVDVECRHAGVLILITFSNQEKNTNKSFLPRLMQRILSVSPLQNSSF